MMSEITNKPDHLKKIAFEVRCPRCGEVIKGHRRKDERQKSFVCKKCSGRWSIMFDPPTSEELEDAFMNKIKLKEICPVVHPENVWELRMKRVKRILEDLLTGEFKDEIQERKFAVRITKLKKGVNARVDRWVNPVTIELNSRRWKKHPELADYNIRETLRHELLHISLKLGDNSPLFKSEAKKRNISTNFPRIKKGYMEG